MPYMVPQRMKEGFNMQEKLIADMYGTPISEQLISFMLEKLGGEDSVMKAFHQEEIERAIREGGTLANVEARLTGPALDAFKQLEVSEVVAAFQGGKRSAKAAKSRATYPRRRTTKAEMEAIREEILSVLRGNAGRPLSRQEITDAAGVDKRVGQRMLASLRKEGLVAKQGNRFDARWQLASAA